MTPTPTPPPADPLLEAAEALIARGEAPQDLLDPETSKRAFVCPACLGQRWRRELMSRPGHPPVPHYTITDRCPLCDNAGHIPLPEFPEHLRAWANHPKSIALAEDIARELNPNTALPLLWALVHPEVLAARHRRVAVRLPVDGRGPAPETVFAVETHATRSPSYVQGWAWPDRCRWGPPYNFPERTYQLLKALHELNVHPLQLVPGQVTLLALPYPDSTETGLPMIRLEGPEAPRPGGIVLHTTRAGRDRSPDAVAFETEDPRR